LLRNNGNIFQKVAQTSQPLYS